MLNTNPSESSSQRFSLWACRVAAFVAASYAIVGGSLTLVGWGLELRRLTDWNDEGISMFPNTATCVICAGIALVLLAKPMSGRESSTAARALGVFVALVGGLTLFQHLSGVSLGIDTLLFNKPWGQRASASPMRMGPPASTSFLTLGVAILLASGGAQWRRVASALSLVVVSIAFLSLIGYWFRADQLFVIPRLTGIAWQTSTMLTALALGLAAALPEHGLVAALRRKDAGGTVMRRLIIPLVVLPILLGWMRIVGQEMNLYDMAFGTAVRTVTEILLFVALLWWTANGISRHATAARKAEQALRESEQRFRMMADAAPVLIWVGGTDERRTWFNKQWLEFVGRALDEELGEGWTVNLHPGDIDRYRRAFTAAFEAKSNISLEYRLRRRDGAYRWILDQGVPRYGSAGQFAGYIGSCVDITERKEAEETLQQTDRRKDEFLATLAHELRNPLAPIGNALEIIKHCENDRELMHEARDVMARQFGQMVRLVDDLLDVGRITRDRLELRKERVELASIIHQAVEMCRMLAEEMGHHLSVDVPPTHVRLNGDPVRLTQVFSNLINNACKFTEPGGRIEIAASTKNGQAAIRVKDTGIGISKQQLESVFQMFSQIDHSLDRTRGGLGIGLAIVKRLVEMHGGRIVAHSEGLDRGSEFVVYLPVEVESVEPAPQTTPSQEMDAAKRRILVADDNRDAANSLAALLRLSGHDVQTAYGGMEAVQKAQSFRPDLVLLDLGMPEMNGYEVCRLIRQSPWGTDIQIVALTGWGQEHDRQSTRQAGFDRHLVKPVDSQMLREVLAGMPDRTAVAASTEPLH